jgi:hypothetical protein
MVMKKFIVAFDEFHFSESTMQYAIYFSRQCRAHLVGIFLTNPTHQSYSYADIVAYRGEDINQYIKVLDERDQEEKAEKLSLFKTSCEEAGLNYSVHHDNGSALKELIHESIYADLLIMSPAKQCQN